CSFAHRDVTLARLSDLFFSRGALVAVVNKRIKGLRVFLIDVYSDAPDLATWEAAFQPLPVRAAIGGFVYARARASVLQSPRITKTVVGRRVKRIRTAAVDDQIDRARVIIDVKNLFPRLPAISSFEDAALFISREEMAHRRHVNDVGIGWIDHDAGGV